VGREIGGLCVAHVFITTARKLGKDDGVIFRIGQMIV